jgi:hypothetical protein
MWKQAAALLDWGFAQPIGAPPVGMLVDRLPVVAPTPSEAAIVRAPASSAAAPLPALPIGVAVAAIGVTTALAMALRRRYRR